MNVVNGRDDSSQKFSRSGAAPDERIARLIATADGGRRKAVVHEACGARPFAVSSAPAAMPIAHMIEATLSSGISIEVVVAEHIAELASGGTDPVAERRRAFDRERKRRAPAKAAPVESQHAPPIPELRSRRLGARYSNDPALRSSVKNSQTAKIAPKNLGRRRVAYHFIAKAALANAGRIVPALLPHGRREGREWTALNPRRADRHLGSFRVRLDAGLWADFALNDVRGGDLISLTAYVSSISQKEAALSLANILGVDPWEPVQ